LFDGIFNIELTVEDWKNTPKFYEKILGSYTKVNMTEQSSYQYSINCSDTHLLIKKNPAPKKPEQMQAKVCVNFSTDNIDKTVKRLESKKVKVSEVYEDETSLWAYMYDIEQNVFGIKQIKNNKGSIHKTTDSDSMVQGLYTIEVAIKDPVNTPKWYEETLEFVPTFRSSNAGYWEYRFNVSNTFFSLDYDYNDSKYSQNNGIFLLFEVKNINKTITQLKEKGIISLEKIENISCCILELNIPDPDGYNIALVQKTNFYQRLKANWK
jgi:predicted enzyme related to lactoylglutathione lyase